MYINTFLMDGSCSFTLVKLCHGSLHPYLHVNALRPDSKTSLQREKTLSRPQCDIPIAEGSVPSGNSHARDQRLHLPWTIPQHTVLRRIYETSPINGNLDDRAAVHGCRLAALAIEALDLPGAVTLDGLPTLNDRDVHQQTADDDAPLVRDALVLEDDGVDLGNVDEREDQTEAGDDGPEEEFVLVDGGEDGEDLAAVRGRVALDSNQTHVEQARVEVFDLPGRDEEGEGEDGEDGGARLEDVVARRVVVLVALLAERGRAVADAEDDRDVGHKAERTHGHAIDHLVDDERLGEDAYFHVAGWTVHDVCHCGFETKSQSQGRRGDEIGPQDFQR